MPPTGAPFIDRFGPAGVRRFGTTPNPLLLPLRVMPYFHTLPDEPESLLAYADSIGKRLDEEDQASWTRLGSDRAFELCVTGEGDVRGVLIGYAEPDRFVSSAPALFAEALLELDILLEVLGAAETPEDASAAFRTTLETLSAADPRAFEDPENWWPLVLEDIRTTASVEAYATFEFTDPDGGRHLVTESGALCAHPEERTWSKMYEAGIEPEQVTRIHTELEACFMPGHYCSMWLELMFPDASLTHNVSYGDTASERAKGIRQLREATRPQAPGTR
ncbi:nucleic acid/nucleotide deaminase domain-containing protein [Streptomyces sp. NPDC006134]|uniref:nucleic acid/nucleotide deaminase domain-containing protein n=1 Tax=Streptomyces sp. NPDC006134 TaxID=3154467 RepID=UPI00340F0671